MFYRKVALSGGKVLAALGLIIGKSGFLMLFQKFNCFYRFYQIGTGVFILLFMPVPSTCSIVETEHLGGLIKLFIPAGIL